MPSMSLATRNGHDPVSGLSFRKVCHDDSEIGHGRRYPHDKDVTALRNYFAGVKRASSDRMNDHSRAASSRFRFRKGRANSNGYVYEIRPGVPFYSDNRLLDPFPVNNNIEVNYRKRSFEANTKRLSLPSSALEHSNSVSSGSGSLPLTLKGPSHGQPLQPLNGGTHLPTPDISRQLSPNSVDVQKIAPVEKNGGAAKVSGDDVGGTSAQASCPPLKSALYKAGPGDKRSQRAHKEVVTFAEYKLPPGMKELHQECFRPGAKACFQHETDVPLLVSTDAAILRRRSSLSQAKRNRVSVAVTVKEEKRETRQILESSSAGNTPTLVRSRSGTSEVFVQPDMQILKACWNIILSFMGDDKLASSTNRAIVTLASPRKSYFAQSKKLWRKSSADIGIQKTSSSALQSPMRTPVSGSRNSMFVLPSAENPNPKKSPKNQSPSVLPNSKTPSPSVSSLTVLEKVHFVANAGLTLPYLRDEIYCLVMKQLVNNPSAYSSVLGWILFALVTGSFPPSERIFFLVQKFIDHHTHSRSKYCGRMLRRSFQNGPRTNPPCSLEIQAAKYAEPILIPVICMDNSAVTVTVDPATTSKELLESVAGKIGIGDPFGYCIVMQSDDKIVNLGAGRFPTMDALSQMELFAGRKFSKFSYRLYFRRDIFSPRDFSCFSDDSMTLRSTFYQVCGGVKTGEYIFIKAPDLSLLVAHRYCIRYGMQHVDDGKVMKFCKRCLPPDVYKSDKKNWCRTVTNTIRALGKKQVRTVNPVNIMTQVIRYAMRNLEQHFVRTFSISTFAKVGGGCTYTKDLLLCLSHRGVTVRQGDAVKVSERSSTDARDNVTELIILVNLLIKDLKSVELGETSARDDGTPLTITDCAGGSYEIISGHGPEIHSVLFRYLHDIARDTNKDSDA